jgi:predicted transcriptional regulator of viral defense system
VAATPQKKSTPRAWDEAACRWASFARQAAAHRRCHLALSSAALPSGAGTLVQVGHGLLRLNRYPEGENEDLVRLYLWSRDREGNPQAVVSHETALRLYGLSDLMLEKEHLSVPRGFRKRSPRGVVLHKQDLAEEVEAWIGFRVTTPLKTIRDAARSQETSPEHLESAVREAVARSRPPQAPARRTLAPERRRASPDRREGCSRGHDIVRWFTSKLDDLS